MEMQPAATVRDYYTNEEIEKVLNDYNKVAQAYRFDIRDKLMSFTATYEEAMDWYFSKDPVNERLFLDVFKSYAYNDEKLAESTTLEMIIEPVLVLSTGQLAVNHLSGDDIKFMLSELTDRNSLKAFRYNVQKINLPGAEEQLQELITVSHIYSEAAELFERNKQLSGGSVPSSFSPDLVIISQTAQDLLDKAIQACNQAIESGDYRFLSLAMSAHMEKSSHYFAHGAINSGEIRKRSQEYGFKELIKAIENYYITRPRNNPDGSSTIDLENRGENGPLHEAMWMLDVSFLFATCSGTLNDACVSPSLQRMDSPLIGKPKINRGIDMTISLPGPEPNGMRDHHYVQLKSRGSKLGKYHPSIVLLGEEKFDDTVSNLNNKIELYKKWIESGYDATLAEEIRDNLLESATRYIQYLENERPNTHKERIVRRIGSVTLEALGFTDSMIDEAVLKMTPYIKA